LARSSALLESIDAQGLRDAETAVALAQISRISGSGRVRPYALQTLENPSASPKIRSIALSLLIEEYQRERDSPAVMEALQQLMRIQKLGDDSRMLGDLYLEQNEPAKAATLFQGA